MPDVSEGLRLMPAQQSPLEEKEPEMTKYKQYEVAVPDKIEINEELEIAIDF
jgi:hypothetical protein